MRDVGRHVMRQLLPTNVSHYVDVPPQSVIVARELLPSETIDLDREHVVAIVTEQGGENSHAAILARAMGIPAVTGVVEATNQITTGTPLLVDGEKGTVTITPTGVAIKDFSVLKQQYDDDAILATEAEKQDCATLDGVGVTLLGNVNRPHELNWIAAHHLNGVGLFRTEFMFMDSKQPPDADRTLSKASQLIDLSARNRRLPLRQQSAPTDIGVSVVGQELHVAEASEKIATTGPASLANLRRCSRPR